MNKADSNSSFRVEQLASRLLPTMSFEVKAGECLCISGPSGVGKSLLLRALADLDVHTGKVWLGNKESHDMKPHEWRREVAYIPAESHWWHDTVAEHFINDIDNMPSRLGFPHDVMQWQVARLSTGEKQRLALLRALQFNPRVVLLDEPTANMDEDNSSKTEKLVLEYMQDHNAMIVWVSHSKEQIKRIADQHIEMHAGDVAA